MRTVELRILCEGPTEVDFARRVLKPHLRAAGVYIDMIDWKGVKPFDRLQRQFGPGLGRLRPHQFVTTMLDLYALPQDYPGDPGKRSTGRVRAEGIEAAMSAALPSPGFIPHVQVHEFEALVFVDLGELTRHFPDGEAHGAAERLERERSGVLPEDINDGANTAPSKRLSRAVPGYDAVKAIKGPLIAEQIGLSRLRTACPHFDQWVSRLERLAVAPSR